MQGEGPPAPAPAPAPALTPACLQTRDYTRGRCKCGAPWVGPSPSACRHLSTLVQYHPIYLSHCCKHRKYVHTLFLAWSSFVSTAGRRLKAFFAWAGPDNGHSIQASAIAPCLCGASRQSHFATATKILRGTSSFAGVGCFDAWRSLAVPRLTSPSPSILLQSLGLQSPVIVDTRLTRAIP